MQVLQSLNQIQGTPDIGVTIGNFDGVHAGHRQLLKKIKSDCERNNLKFVVVTFTPHPQKILNPEREHFLLTSYEQRRNLLNELGVDILIEINFTRDFSTLTPENFLLNYLLIYPKISRMYLGYDFAFGANKQGGHDLIKSIFQTRGISVEVQPVFKSFEQIVSSSLVRGKILSGNIADVTKILERPFVLEGVVVKGEGRGKKIGYPTANIQISENLIIPKKGVYVTRTVYKGMTYRSVSNIGNNPTFKDGNQLHIETHLFDFNIDIYGENIEIEFIHKIRDEIKFSTVNDLVEQIKKDVVFTKSHLESLCG